MAWTAIPDTVLEPGDPVRSVDLLALRDNFAAMAAGDAGAPILPAQFIASGVVSAAASLDITDLLATFRAYMLVFDEALPATSGDQLGMRTSSDNGSTFDSGVSDYGYARYGAKTGDLTVGFVGDDDNATILLSQAWGNAAGNEGGGFVIIHNPMDAGHKTVTTHQISLSSAGNEAIAGGRGSRQAAVANDAVQFLFISGNIATMQWTLYGLRAS